MRSIAIKVLLAGGAIFPLLLPAAAEPNAPDDTVYIFPVIPDEAAKVEALKRAYRLNGNSMVGLTMIDLTNQPLPVKTEPIAPDPPAPLVKLPKAAPWPGKVADVAPLPKPAVDVCSRHGLRKVTIDRGRSWRCRH